MTGDRDMVGGFFKDRIQFQHTTASFPGLVANALNKALVREWDQLGHGRLRLVDRRSSASSTSRASTTSAGSSSAPSPPLPTVAEGAEYTELTIGDSPETSSFVKKGGYIGLTLEAIDRDDGRKLRQIPRELAFAGLREISALVAAVFTDNTKRRPHARRHRRAVQQHRRHHQGRPCQPAHRPPSGTDFAAWDAVAAAMYNQPMLVENDTGYYGTGKKMAIEPKYCLVPRDLEGRGRSAVHPALGGTSQHGRHRHRRRLHTYGGYVEPIIVPEWTDATDWAAVADPAIMPGIMIGERFGLVPQIFVAGTESDPAMFANDEQRIKVRHFIAVGVADFRPSTRTTSKSTGQSTAPLRRAGDPPQTQ